MKKIIPIIIVFLTISACTNSLKDNVITDEEGNIVVEEEIVDIVEIDSDSVIMLWPHLYPDIVQKKLLEK